MWGSLRLAPIIFSIYGTSVTRAPLYILYAVSDIFRQQHKETFTLSGTTCIIIAESAKRTHSVCLNVRACLEKIQWLWLPSYLLNCLWMPSVLYYTIIRERRQLASRMRVPWNAKDTNWRQYSTISSRQLRTTIYSCWLSFLPVVTTKRPLPCYGFRSRTAVLKLWISFTEASPIMAIDPGTRTARSLPQDLR